MKLKNVLSEQEFYYRSEARPQPRKVKALSYPSRTADGYWHLTVQDTQTLETINLTCREGYEDQGPNLYTLLEG